MPKISEMRESKFLKKDDVGRGVLATIASCQQHNVAMEGAAPEHKWCLSFHELDKPLVLNSTNIQLCAQICGSDDTDHWIGKRVVLYTDPNVSYAGKLIGGIRVRAPRPTAPPVQAPQRAWAGIRVRAPRPTAPPVQAPQRAWAPPPPPPPEPPFEPLTDDDIPF